ncbi:MAG TPA: hypothetical protein VLX60_08980 [Terriglobales bacterium]|nr:hypothetical protein [Terriglobales bacterium]
MKLSISVVRVICLVMTFLLLLTALVQEPLSGATQGDHPGVKIVARAPWRVSGKEGHLLCEVSQKEAGGDGSSTRVLTIYRARGVKLLAFDTPDSLASMYQIGDYDGRLITTWVAGSAYHVRAWAFIDGQVKAVFNRATRLMPEIVYDEQGREAILITDPTLDNGRWAAAKGTTTVFKWTGEKYDEIGTVSWNRRFLCASAESCTSLVGQRVSLDLR